MEWRYTGLHNGKRVSGILSAEDVAELRAKLRERAIIPIKIKELKSRTKTAIRRRDRIDRALSYVTIGQASIEQTFLQLEILLKGDVPVVEAFETAARLTKSYLASALMETAEQVRSGSSLKKAMETQMPWIGALHLGLIGVGEANGSLPQMFSYCVELMQQRRKLRNEVVRAMTYPVIVTLMGMGVGYYVSTVAVPQIASVMGSPDKLPPITRSLLDTSDWVKTNGYLFVVVPAVGVAVIALLRRIPLLAPILDRIGLYIPLFGKVGRFSGNTLFNHTMALLLGSGVSVTESLALVGTTLTNAFYRVQIQFVRDSVLAGRMLSAGLEASAFSYLSPLTPALVRVGENSGSLEEGLRYVGEFYGQALERRLDLLGKLVEPALIVVVGGMVAYVYIAFFMGMAAMNASVQ